MENDCSWDLFWSHEDYDKEYDADLVIFVQVDEEEGVLAYAYPC